jgi:hypothetical protein
MRLCWQILILRLSVTRAIGLGELDPPVKEVRVLPGAYRRVHDAGGTRPPGALANVTQTILRDERLQAGLPASV